MSEPFRIATRRSPLALWQAHHVADRLRPALGDREIEFVADDTTADQRLDLPISELGGKGAFAKEIQARVLHGRADCAVHSAKDLQSVTPDGLALAAVVERGEVRDALVGATLAELPVGAVVATGSNRRRLQLARRRPDLRIIGLRGNIQTRLARLDPGHDEPIDALVMAAVALLRLELGHHIAEILGADVMLPQVGQGAVAVECGADDDATQALLAGIDHAPTRRSVDAERAFLATLGGDCELPAAAWCPTVADGDELHLSALLHSRDEATSVRLSVRGSDPGAVGREAAERAAAQVGR